MSQKISKTKKKERNILSPYIIYHCYNEPQQKLQNQQAKEKENAIRVPFNN